MAVDDSDGIAEPSSSSREAERQPRRLQVRIPQDTINA
jgi:hypothetical protein